MRLQVPALGVTLALLLAGCADLTATGGNGWRIFDSAFDGLENAELVDASGEDDFDHSFEGASPFGHKAYYESPLRANETLALAFRSDAGPQVALELRAGSFPEYRCDGASASRPAANWTVDDEIAVGRIEAQVGECRFELTLRRDVEASNGVHLVWEATTVAMDARDQGPGGGAPLRFEASRTAAGDQPG